MLGHEDLQDGDEVENEDRMKPLTLEFKSEALEASFRLYYGNRLAPRVVSALFEFAVVFGVWTLIDILYKFGGNNIVWGSFGIKITVMLGCALLALIIGTRPVGSLDLFHFNAITAIVVHGLMTANFFWGYFSPASVVGTVQVLIVCTILATLSPLFRQPFVAHCFTSLSVTSVYMVAAILVEWDLVQQNKSPYVIVAVGFYIMCAFFTAQAYYTERAVRSGYIVDLKKKRKEMQNIEILDNMLPIEIVDKLMTGETGIFDVYDEISILFTKIVKFDSLTESLAPMELVQYLNYVFSQFDTLTDLHAVYKVETVGCVYLVCAGCPQGYETPYHAQTLCSLAIDLQFVMSACQLSNYDKIEITVGIHSGQVIAGIVGDKYPRYRLMGDTVNTASRMSTTCDAGDIQISNTVTAQLALEPCGFTFTQRGNVFVKGKGEMMCSLLTFGPCCLSVGGRKIMASDPIFKDQFAVINEIMQFNDTPEMYAEVEEQEAIHAATAEREQKQIDSTPSAQASPITPASVDEDPSPESSSEFDRKAFSVKSDGSNTGTEMSKTKPSFSYRHRTASFGTTVDAASNSFWRTRAQNNEFTPTKEVTATDEPVNMTPNHSDLMEDSEPQTPTIGEERSMAMENQWSPRRKKGGSFFLSGDQGSSLENESTPPTPYSRSSRPYKFQAITIEVESPDIEPRYIKRLRNASIGGGEDSEGDSPVFKLSSNHNGSVSDDIKRSVSDPTAANEARADMIRKKMRNSSIDETFDMDLSSKPASAELPDTGGNRRSPLMSPRRRKSVFYDDLQSMATAKAMSAAKSITPLQIMPISSPRQRPMTRATSMGGIPTLNIGPNIGPNATDASAVPPRAPMSPRGTKDAVFSPFANKAIRNRVRRMSQVGMRTPHAYNRRKSVDEPASSGQRAGILSPKLPYKDVKASSEKTKKAKKQIAQLSKNYNKAFNRKPERKERKVKSQDTSRLNRLTAANAIDKSMYKTFNALSIQHMKAFSDDSLSLAAKHDVKRNTHPHQDTSLRVPALLKHGGETKSPGSGKFSNSQPGSGKFSTASLGKRGSMTTMRPSPLPHFRKQPSATHSRTVSAANSPSGALSLNNTPRMHSRNKSHGAINFGLTPNGSPGLELRSISPIVGGEQQEQQQTTIFGMIGNKNYRQGVLLPITSNTFGNALQVTQSGSPAVTPFYSRRSSLVEDTINVEAGSLRGTPIINNSGGNDVYSVSMSPRTVGAQSPSGMASPRTDMTPRGSTMGEGTGLPVTNSNHAVSLVMTKCRRIVGCDLPFPEEDQEKAFNQYTNAKIEQDLGYTLEVMALFVLSVACYDYWDMPRETFLPALVIRGMFIVMAVTQWFVRPSLQPEMKRYMITAYFAFVAALVICIGYMHGHLNRIYTSAQLIVWCTVLSSRSTLQYRNVLGLNLAAMVLFCVYIVLDSTNVAELYQVFMVAVMYTRMSYGLDVHNRQDYAKLVSVKAEHAQMANFLNNMLPRAIMDEISATPNDIIVHERHHANVMFTDIVSFTAMCARIPPEDVVAILNVVFAKFDEITSNFGVYKVETVGDAYLCCTGVVDLADNAKIEMEQLQLASGLIDSECSEPGGSNSAKPRARPATEQKKSLFTTATEAAEATRDIVRCALEFKRVMMQFSAEDGSRMRIRTGIHTGDVIAGVIGFKMPRYHLFGDAVTIAEEVESAGTPDEVVISDSVYDALKLLGEETVLEEFAMTPCSTVIYDMFKTYIVNHKTGFGGTKAKDPMSRSNSQTSVFSQALEHKLSMFDSFSTEGQSGSGKFGGGSHRRVRSAHVPSILASHSLDGFTSQRARGLSAGHARPHEVTFTPVLEMDQIQMGTAEDDDTLSQPSTPPLKTMPRPAFKHAPSTDVDISSSAEDSETSSTNSATGNNPAVLTIHVGE